MILDIDMSTKYLDSKDFQFLEWKYFDDKGNVVLAYKHNGNTKRVSLPKCILKEDYNLNTETDSCDWNKVTTEIVRMYLTVLESCMDWKITKNFFSKINIGGDSMVIGIIGSRSRNHPVDFMQVEKAFFDIYEKGDWICSGGCPQGGDKFAEVIAKDNGIPILIFWADPETKPKSYFERNTDIAEHSDILIACITDDDSKCKGTMDTVKKFKKKNPTGRVYLAKELNKNKVELMGEPDDLWG